MQARAHDALTLPIAITPDDAVSLYPCMVCEQGRGLPSQKVIRIGDLCGQRGSIHYNEAETLLCVLHLPKNLQRAYSLPWTLASPFLSSARLSPTKQHVIPKWIQTG
jgi:hypothetical protein